MRVLVTGATGYVGRHVAEKLARRGDEVSGLVRDRSRATALPDGVRPATADLRDLEAIAALAAGHDAVLHAGFAGHGTDWFEAVAIEHALIGRLVAALAGTSKTLVVSNGSLFLGDSGAGRLDETAPVPPNHPAAVRASATGQATAAAEIGVRGIELRLASFVYGHGGSVFLPILARFARASKRSLFVGDGRVATSAVHVEAAADAYLAALDHGEAGATYHIAADEEPLIHDIADAVALAAGDGCRAEGVDQEEAARLLDPFTAMFLATNNRLDSRRARRELGWSAAGHPPLLWDVAFGSYAPARARAA